MRRNRCGILELEQQQRFHDGKPVGFGKRFELVDGGVAQVASSPLLANSPKSGLQ